MIDKSMQLSHNYVSFSTDLSLSGGTVKSEEFDIRLTIYLLGTLAKYKIDSEYPDPSDLSDSAMLSRIKYIRKKATMRFEADISEDKLKQYWNDIRQVKGYFILLMLHSRLFLYGSKKRDYCQHC